MSIRTIFSTDDNEKCFLRGNLAYKNETMMLQNSALHNRNTLHEYIDIENSSNEIFFTV